VKQSINRRREIDPGSPNSLLAALRKS